MNYSTVPIEATASWTSDELSRWLVLTSRTGDPTVPSGDWRRLTTLCMQLALATAGAHQISQEVGNTTSSICPKACFVKVFEVRQSSSTFRLPLWLLTKAQASLLQTNCREPRSNVNRTHPSSYTEQGTLQHPNSFAAWLPCKNLSLSHG